MADSRPIPSLRSDGTFDPIDMESWMRSVRAVLSGLASQMNAAITEGNAIDVTYVTGAYTITLAVRKASASADAAAITATTVTGTAGAAYTAAEQTIINSLVAEHNKLITDVGVVRTSLNDLKGKLRTYFLNT